MTHNTPRLLRASPALMLMAATAVGLLAPVEMQPAEAAFPGDNGKIAFSSDRTSGTGVNNPTGDFEIFAIKADGKGIQQLTDNTADDHQPAWSADGNWIAYTNYEEVDGEIFMHTDGYFDHGLFVFPVTRRLTTNTVFDVEPAFSPDGNRIAYASRASGDTEISVMDTADNNTDGNGDNQTTLTSNTVSDFAPAWSPDGEKIAFVSERDGNSEIFVMDATGTNPVNLTNSTAFDKDPNWSPDGSRIVFTRREDNNSDIYMMNADGSEPKRLTKKAAFDEHPAWSPDGTKIAFQTNRGGGDAEIYVMKARPESRKNQPKNLTRNDLDDFGTTWRPIP